VMVGAMGTSDAEAVAIGCPVVRVALMHFDFSPTSDLPDAGVEVSSTEELRSAIEAAFDGDSVARGADRLVATAFFRLDGLAGDRIAAVLADRPADAGIEPSRDPIRQGAAAR
jgi:hypothetical protein